MTSQIFVCLHGEFALSLMASLCCCCSPTIGTSGLKEHIKLFWVIMKEKLLDTRQTRIFPLLFMAKAVVALCKQANFVRKKG